MSLMLPSRIRVDQKAPNWPWDPSDPCQIWTEAGTVLLCSPPCGSPTGVALFEPRSSSCWNLRIQGKWRKKKPTVVLSQVLWRLGPLEMVRGILFRGGLDFSVRWTSTLPCFRPVCNVLFQLSGFSSLPLITLLVAFACCTPQWAERLTLLRTGRDELLCCERMLPAASYPVYCQQLALKGAQVPLRNRKLVKLSVSVASSNEASLSWVFRHLGPCRGQVISLYPPLWGESYNTARLATQHHGTTRLKLGAQSHIKRQCPLWRDFSLE